MPTRTINQLHFEDLSPNRFEDLCLAMVYRFNKWENIEHIGKAGADGGVDIRATERTENGTLRTWLVQCKRYKSLSLSDIRNAIDKILRKNKLLSDVLLFIVSCNVSKKCFDGFHNYAKEKGIKSSFLWPASLLEAKLYSESRDLLFAYFDVNTALDVRNRISSIKHSVKLKARMRKDFVLAQYDFHEASRKPYRKFAHSDVIIHSIYDDIYPDVDEKGVGISPWFKVELYDFYYNGLEVMLRVHNGIIDKSGNWDIVKYGAEIDEKKYQPIHILETGRIPFENIVDYDLAGDEFYNFPHIYCEFGIAGMPYEDFFYRIFEEGQYPATFEKNKRISRVK